MMGKLIDLTGQKFGRLIVIKRVENPKERKTQRSLWLCVCECGEEVVVRSDSLKNGSIQSCGCLHSEFARKIGRLNLKKDARKLPPMIASFNKTYEMYKSSATKRGFLFDLDKDYFYEITQKNCYYCGKEPANKSKNSYNNGDYIYNGIDRLDNSIGYIDGNTVPCCSVCNHAKHTLGEQEFLSWIERVYNYSIANKKGESFMMTYDQAKEYLKNNHPQWEQLDDVEKETLIQELIKLINNVFSTGINELNDEIRKINKSHCE